MVINGAFIYNVYRQFYPRPDFEMKCKTAPRGYDNSVRSAATDEKRRYIIEATAQFLRSGSLSTFSLDAVAREAGVSRLTLYNQFGSRSGLLEAVLDRLADGGGLARLQDAITDPSPDKGLESLVEIFCNFWRGDAAVERLQDAAAIDADFAPAVKSRGERRRRTITALVERIPLDPPAAARRAESIDLLFALTSFAMFRQLRDAPSRLDPCRAIQRACRDELARLRATVGD